MKLGFVGLGRMGGNMVENLLGKRHDVVCYDVTPASVQAMAAKGATPASNLAELADKLEPPRIVWIMVPAGETVDKVIEGLLPGLAAGDVLVDGGNSFYKDSVRRAEQLASSQIHFLDCGTSGGLEGAATGASMMIGGEAAAVETCRPLFDALAAPNGWGHFGPSGAGHFVKMVHNGIEYALEEAYGEGFELLKSGPYDLDLAKVATVWNNGSVIRSWLNELAGDAFSKDAELSEIAGVVGGGETGGWTVNTAIELGVPVPTIALALLMRYRSRETESFAGKVIAAVRNEFGGHEVVRETRVRSAAR